MKALNAFMAVGWGLGISTQFLMKFLKHFLIWTTCLSSSLLRRYFLAVAFAFAISFLSRLSAHLIWALIISDLIFAAMVFFFMFPPSCESQHEKHAPPRQPTQDIFAPPPLKGEQLVRLAWGPPDKDLGKVVPDCVPVDFPVDFGKPLDGKMQMLVFPSEGRVMETSLLLGWSGVRIQESE